MIKSLKFIFILFYCTFSFYAQTTAHLTNTISTDEYPIPYITKDRDKLLTLNVKVEYLQGKIGELQDQNTELKNEIKKVKS